MRMPSARFNGTVDLRALLHAGSEHSALVHLDCPGAAVYRSPELTCLVSGTPRATDELLQALIARDGLAAALAQAWRHHGEKLPGMLQGGFALVVIDTTGRKVLMAVDRFAVQTLCHARDGPLLYFSDRADSVAVTDRTLSRQAIFDYLYFHMIPAPGTVFRAVKRLPMAQACVIDIDGTRHFDHRPARFSDQRPDFDTARKEFMGLVQRSVQHEIEGQTKVRATG